MTRLQAGTNDLSSIALGPIQSPIQGIPGTFSMGIKQLAGDVNLSLTSV
jgi:hypothetical protein